MFGTIFKKELLDQILSPKFLIVSLLCLALLPASLLLNCAGYESAFHEYDSSQKEAKVTTVVYREPSVLSTFGVGLESVLPKTVTFSKYQTEAKGTQAQNEVLSNINGKLDYPKFCYQFPAFEDTLKSTAPDIILLVLFNLIFFAAAYYSFIRYDVR